MNRNTILAFLLILITISFFSSRFYYEKILKQPHPSTARKEQVAQKSRKRQDEAVLEENQEREAPPLLTQPTEIKEDRIVVAEQDSALVEEPAKSDTIWVETDKIIVGISELGGRIISIKTKDYRVNPIAKEKSIEENPYVEMVHEPQFGGANLTINKEVYDSKLFICQLESNEARVEGSEKAKISFLHTSSQGEILEKSFFFVNDSYIIGLSVHSATLDGKKVGVGWKAGIRESEAPSGRSMQYDVRKIHLFDSKNVSHITEKKAGKSEESGYYKWVGLTSKYFLVALISDSARDADVAIEAFKVKKTEEEETKKKKRGIEIDYRFCSKRFAQGTTESYSLYAGPSSLSLLKEQKIKLEKVMFGGWKWFLRADLWFPALCEFVLWLLIFLQKGLRDYGLVIIVLTILSKLVTYPLTQSSMKSMSRMRELQPKVNAIRDKYKSNPQKMNQKMMELYKQEGVNPLNPGCLPMFLQMPIFISLFIVLRKAIELRGQGTWIIPWIKDLSKPEVLPIPGINPLPFDIPMYGNNIALLPIAMAVLTYFQNKATIKDPNQKAMIYFMPIFMLVLFNSFPAGLVLYWTFSSVVQLAQQFITDKRKNLPQATVEKQGNQRNR